MMDFTFGIITNNGTTNVNKIIDSIEKQNIPNYEVIIVGNCDVKRDKCTIIEFNESIKPMWITKKKNIITQMAKYDNIVYLHDYVVFEDGWYEGQKEAGNDFDIRMDIIKNIDGKRYRDWCIWPHNGNKMDSLIGRDCLIPYDITHLSKYMYISGLYWISKKIIMEEYPLDETLSWGQGEDVVWSKIVREKYSFNMNTKSSVRIIKSGKDRVFNEPDENKIKILKEIK